MSAVSVTLVPQFQKDYEEGDTVGFRLRIDVTNATGIDAEIFRYFRKPATETNATPDSVLSGVCSWPDLEELPTDEPEPDTLPAGFRLSYIDIVVSSQSLAEDVWDLIKTQVAELVQTVSDGETLEAESSYVITST